MSSHRRRRATPLSATLLIPLVAAACASPPQDTVAPTFAIELTDAAAREMGSLGLDLPVTGRAYVILTR